MSRPRVIVNCVADKHLKSWDRGKGRSERIVEFASEGPDGTTRGGLISFRKTHMGTLRVDVYRTDPGVEVLADRLLAGKMMMRRPGQDAMEVRIDEVLDDSTMAEIITIQLGNLGKVRLSPEEDGSITVAVRPNGPEADECEVTMHESKPGKISVVGREAFPKRRMKAIY